MILRIALLLSPLLLFAQATRIQVPAGGPVVTVEGDVEKDKEVTFIFQAKKGLKFSGQLTTKSGKAGFSVEDAEGKGLPEEEFDYNTKLTGSLQKTGDYKIVIATFDPRRVHFMLTVRVY